jgi:glyoxylase-like metal-dependent hydrolase (beta-lactamase superfamily II)
VGDDAALLVDTGIDDSVREHLLPYLDKIGLSRSALRYAVLTHSDFDHIGGNAALRESCPNALFLCGEDDRPMIEDLELMISDRYGEFGADHGVPDDEEMADFARSVSGIIPVELGLTGGETIQLGGRTVQILHTPGHSWGHLSVYDPLTDALVIGDAVLYNGLYTSEGEPAFPPTYRFLDTYRATTARMLAMDPTLLLTAHYPVYRDTECRDFLAESMAYTHHVDAMLERALSVEPTPLVDLVDATAAQLGPWPSDTAALLVYPLLGHLEAFVQRGSVNESRLADGRLAYSAA